MSTHPSAMVHPTAIVEPGVEIGERTRVYDAAHIRGPGTVIGTDCIIGGKSYVAYGVTIGDRAKINSFVYVCTAVTIETGVMVSAGTIFTNDVFPRATSPDLSTLRGSDPDEATRPTLVAQGATLGAGTVVGCDLRIGRFAMTGMGTVVTRSVGDFVLVVGNPGRIVGVVCRCGAPLVRGLDGRLLAGSWRCSSCDRSYASDGSAVSEIE